MLNWINTYGKPDHANHEAVVEKLKEGYYAIALMNKGLWTSSGHFVVLWWQDDKVRINDPASTKDARVNGDIRTFRSQAKYYWLIDAREFNEEDDDMDQTKFNEMFKTAMTGYRKELQDNDSGEWSKAAREWAVENGLFRRKRHHGQRRSQHDVGGRRNPGAVCCCQQAALRHHHGGCQEPD